MDASVSTFDLIAFDLVAPPVDSATPPDLNAFDLVAAPVDAATPTDLNALDLDQSRALSGLVDGGVYRIEPPARCSGVDPAARAWLNANIMSLGGIAISIGVLVDGAIVEVENGPSDEGAGAAWPAARCD